MTDDDTQTGVRLSDLTQPRWQTYREVAEAVRDDAPEAQRSLAGYLSNASYDVERLTRDKDEFLRWLNAVEAARDEAYAENERLRAALTLWQHCFPAHRAECRFTIEPCSCGLQEARDATRAALAGDVGDTAA